MRSPYLATLILVFGLTGCELLPPQPVSPSESGGQIPCPPDSASHPSATTPYQGSAIWFDRYVDIGKLSTEARQQQETRTRARLEKSPSVETRLMLATVLAHNADAKAWQESKLLLDKLSDSVAQKTYTVWLSEQIDQRINRLELQHQLDLERQLALDENQRLKNELTELQRKIEALTAIEQTLIEQQTD